MLEPHAVQEYHSLHNRLFDTVNPDLIAEVVELLFVRWIIEGGNPTRTVAENERVVGDIGCLTGTNRCSWYVIGRIVRERWIAIRRLVEDLCNQLLGPDQETRHLFPGNRSVG